MEKEKRPTIVFAKKSYEEAIVRGVIACSFLSKEETSVLLSNIQKELDNDKEKLEVFVYERE